jgi:hypothetical protein
MKRFAFLIVGVFMALSLTVGIATTAAAANPKHALYGLETVLEGLFGGPDKCFSLKDGITFQQYQTMLRNEEIPKDVVRSCYKHVEFPSLSPPGEGGSCAPFPEGVAVENAIVILDGQDVHVVHFQESGNVAYTLVEDSTDVTIDVRQENGAMGSNMVVLEVSGTNIHIVIDQGGAGGNRFHGIFVGDNINHEESQSGGESCSFTYPG